MSTVLVLKPQANLIQVISALGSTRRLENLLDSRQKQADQDRDNRNLDQQFNHREATTLSALQSDKGSQFICSFGFPLVGIVACEKDVERLGLRHAHRIKEQWLGVRRCWLRYRCYWVGTADRNVSFLEVDLGN